MSRYAKIVEPLGGWIDGKTYCLTAGTPIKNVKMNPDKGGYSCEILAAENGHVRGAAGKTWVRFVTQMDLPAFTDKGRAHREEHDTPATLRRGRPRIGEEPAIKRLVCKVTPEQYADVERRAAALELTIPEYIRQKLFENAV